MPLITPSTSVRNLSPSSTEPVSESSSGAGGTTEAAQIEHGHVRDPFRVTLTPPDAISRFPVSSKARLRMLTVPEPAAVHEKVQLVVPVAARQVVPPAVDTSTPVTTPPPFSTAVPAMVNVLP